MGSSRRSHTTHTHVLKNARPTSTYVCSTAAAHDATSDGGPTAHDGTTANGGSTGLPASGRGSTAATAATTRKFLSEIRKVKMPFLLILRLTLHASGVHSKLSQNFNAKQ